MTSCYNLFDSVNRVDIEAQMTMFAYYYIGIGLGVLLVSYFQVSVIAFLYLLMHSEPLW